MAQMQVFVSHSHEDDTFCRGIVGALRGAGADVWYDKHNLHGGQLMEVIQRELDQRPIFILVLSKHAFASKWVKRETTWAYELYDRDPSRLILPVTAGDIERGDFSGASGWLFLSGFQRIEAPGWKPFPMEEACGRLLHALALTAPGEAPVVPTPQPSESVDDLLAQGKALIAQRKYAEAVPFLERAVQLDPHSFDAWASLGLAYNETGQYGDGLAACERALALDDTQAWVWGNKGIALRSVGRHREALAAYERALTLDSNLTLLWFNQGVALFGLTHYEEALAAFDHALALDDKDAATWACRAVTLWALGSTTKARGAEQRARELGWKG